MMRARVLAAWSLLGCACARDDAQRYDLGGLTVIEDFDEPICGGTFPYFQHRLRWLEQETGLALDPRGLAYHWYLDETQVDAACDFALGGCTKGRSFFGNLYVFSHELVHAHLSRLGSPRVWLEEGMATMLENERSLPPDPLSTPSVMMQTEDAFDLNYAAAGAFTRYLRERYGIASLLDYYEASTGTDATAAIAIFEEVLGDRFADVEADYLNSGPHDISTSLDCDGPPSIAWDSETWEHTFQLACEARDAVGPEQSQNDARAGTFLWSRVTMMAPAGWISLDLKTPSPTWISLISCEGRETVYVDAAQTHAEAYLAGGRYLVFADAFTDDAPAARVAVRPLDAPPAPLRPSPPPGLLSHGAGGWRMSGARPAPVRDGADVAAR